MNFEKIELIGFKSFANKVVITFDSGVTGIVGPNGCGKSNIADAVRWVLGEQSAKTLRGSSMTDVIFNGTQNRKSLSYCEVSLYFDNSDKIFKSCEYNEVILTRKLFRSGESEYYINKQPSRMRDIINLLHECGVSKSGYTIIGQGKVSEIFSSSPENRRVIFEEAVGIAKLKTEKVEHERKLLRTRENIVRVSDVIDVMAQHLEPLSKQAEKTKRFLEISNQLKYHEINNYLYKYENASIIKNKITARINGLDEEYAARSIDAENAQKSYEAHMQEVSESDIKLNEITQEILDKSVGKESIMGETKLYRERISVFRTDIDRLNANSAEQKEKIELKGKAIAAKQEYLACCRKEMTDLSSEIGSLEDRLIKVLNNISKGENLTQSAQSKILQTAETLADISKNLGSLDTEKNVISVQQRETLDKINALSNAHSQLLLERERTVSEINANKSLQEALKAKTTATEAEISSLNNKISELANKIYSINMEINSKAANLKIYQNLKDSFEGYPQSVRKLMLSARENRELNSRIKGVVASIINTATKYETAIQTALGSAVQNIVTATPDDAKYLIEYLKRTEGGRVTFLPVSSVKSRVDGAEITKALSEKGSLGLATSLVKFDDYYKSVVQFLLGNTLIVDNIDNAVLIAQKYRFAFKIVTLEGDILAPSGSMTGGSKKLNQTNLLSTDGMINKLEEEIAAKNKDLNALNNEKSVLTEKSNSGVDFLDKINDEYQVARQNYSALVVKLENLEDLIASNEKELNSNKGFIESVSSRLSKISEEFKNIEEGNKKLVEEKQSASTDALKHQTEYDKYKKERDELINTSTIKKTRLSFLDAELKSTNEDIARMLDEKSDAENIIVRNNATVVEFKASIDKLVDKIEELSANSEISLGLTELKQEKLNLENRKRELNEEIKHDDLNRQYFAAELAKIGDKKHEEELAIAKVDSELDYMEQRVQEEYGATYETCKEMRDPEYDITTSSQEINQLKHKIAILGTINPNAIQEFADQSVQYNDYIVQKEDLEKAENDIKTALTKIKAEMLNVFNDGFEQIRTHFKKIFKELFGGGQADLVLDYSTSDDPLDAGVEIVAEPPGKKLQKISLLSGGEMSLTAIAILFAILKLRPMPFCVLDEIEAALDDANVERFAKYLKKFSSETQFIVITHKKVTMELSDALFGVTMPEKGVSHIVSVKLSDIKDTIDID